MTTRGWAGSSKRTGMVVAEASEYVTIDRPRARDIAVPLSILRVSDDHLVLPFGMTVVEGAPNVSPRRRTMTIEEKWTLDSFYSLWTGVAGAAGRDSERSISSNKKERELK